MTEREQLEAVEKIARRVQGKIMAAFEESKWGGKVKSNVLILDREEAELVQRATQRFADDLRKRIEKRERRREP